MSGYSAEKSRVSAARPAPLTADALDNMTIAEIRALAAERGYTLTKTKKAELIAEFLAQQEG